MSQELIELEIDEISLVDAGANQFADVILFKNKNTKEKSMTIDELAAQVAAMAEQLNKVMELLKPEAAEEQVVEPQKEEVVAKALIEDEVEVVKSEVVVTLEKQLADKDAIIKSYEEKDTVAKFDAKASEFKNLPMEAKELSKALRDIDSLKSKDSLLTMFKALDAQLASSDITKAVGVSGELNAGDNESKVELIAKQIQQDEKVTIEKARTLARLRNPELLK